MQNSKGKSKNIYEKLINHMALGMSEETFPATVNMLSEDWNKKKQNDAKMKKALALGEQKLKYYWEKLGICALTGESSFVNANGDTIYIEGTVSYQIWWANMKNRFGWQDKPSDPDDLDLSKKNIKITLPKGIKI